MNEVTCIDIQELLERRGDGTLGRHDEARLDAHVAKCIECAADLDLVDRLSDETIIPEPAETDLARMRRGVMREIEAPRRRNVARWIAAAAVLAVTFAGGLLVGNRRMPDSRPIAAAPSLRSDAMASEIHTAATRHRRIEDVENSPFLYANVQVSEVDERTLELRFDVSRHMEMKLPKRDPLVAEILVQSMLQPNDVGEKLSAISASEDLRDPKLRPALVKTMLTDENVAVRLKAQEKLVEQPADAQVQSAMLDVLRKDNSVQMRLVAIDYLTRHHVAPQVLRQAVETGDQEGSSVLYLRTSAYTKVRGES